MINLKTENNKDIFIFDDVFESHNTQKFYDFIINSHFQLNLDDSNSSDYHNNKSFGSSYSIDDLKKLGVIEFLPENIKKQFNISLETNDRVLVNAITSCGVFHPHDDSGQGATWSFLYYANMKWDLEWGGDTLFLKDDRLTIEHITQCRPNRVVIFDATIPHLIRPTTNIAPPYRFSINMTFKGVHNE